MPTAIVNPLIWIGSLDVQEQPNSPHYNQSASRRTCVRIYRGPYDNVLAAEPSPGQNMSDIAANLIIETVDIEKMEGGIGQMTINLARESTTFPSPTAQDPTYEIDWQQVERKLATHVIFSAGGTYALDATNYNQIAEWEAASTAAAKLTAYNAMAAGGHGQKYCDKINAGQETYLDFAPIARKTSYVYQPATAASVGKRGAPTGFPTALPVQANGAAAIWLKTADRNVRTGRNRKWERVEEWTGAGIWDTDIYPAA